MLSYLPLRLYPTHHILILAGPFAAITARAPHAHVTPYILFLFDLHLILSFQIEYPEGEKREVSLSLW